MPRRGKQNYDPDRFRGLVEPLLEQEGESYRQASMAAGLDETAISRYFRGSQPMRDACIALADYFHINPNEMLEAAGYEPLHFFDRRMIDPNAMPPDIDQLTGEIMRIENDAVREEVVDTLRQVLRIQMQMREAAIKKALKKAGVHTETAFSG